MAASHSSHMAEEDALGRLFRDALGGDRARTAPPPGLWWRVRRAARLRRFAAYGVPPQGLPLRASASPPGLRQTSSLLDLDR